MNKYKKGLVTPLIIAVVVILAAGGLYVFTKNSSVSDPIVPSTSTTENTNTTQSTNQNPRTSPIASCDALEFLSVYVNKNIAQPDKQSVMPMNSNVITSIQWKRDTKEPFISYPIVAGVEAMYGGVGTTRSQSSIVSMMKTVGAGIEKEMSAAANNLGLIPDALNTTKFQSFVGQEKHLQTFGFKKGSDLYTIVLKVENGTQAPAVGYVTVACGKVLSHFDKFYDSLSFKADASVTNPYYNDQISVSDVSPDQTVYALRGSNNHVKIANYYYFNGTPASLKLVSSDSYPADCKKLESQKVGKGMRCSDSPVAGQPNYTQRTVSY